MKQGIKEILENGTVLARYIPNSSLKEGLGFYSNEDEFIQVGSWNYPAGKVLQAHNHHIVERNINRTQEVVVVLKGSIHVSVYNENDELKESFTANQGDVFIMLAGGHGYEILEDDTLAIEIKNGPYPGAEIDRRRL